MSEHQAWFLGAKVGKSRSTREGCWQEIHDTAMTFYPDNPRKRRAFEDLCEIAQVIAVSCTPESATEVRITGANCIMQSQNSASHCEMGSK